MILQHINANGIRFVAPATIQAIDERHDGGLISLLSNKQEIAADIIVFNQGTSPNSHLASAAGIALYDDASIVVNDELKTNDPDIFAAGIVVWDKNDTRPDIFFLRKALIKQSPI